MFAVLIGFLLETLLQALARPLAAFREHFLFDLAQRARSLGLGGHGPPGGCGVFRMGGEPFTPPLWGQCQDAPVFDGRI